MAMEGSETQEGCSYVYKIGAGDSGEVDGAGRLSRLVNNAGI